MHDYQNKHEAISDSCFFLGGGEQFTMGALSILGDRLVKALTISIVIMFACNLWINHKQEKRLVDHAEFVDKVCEVFPEARSNEYIGEGTRRADKRIREALVPALQRIFFESRIYKICDVHQWIVWSVAVSLVAIVIFLWFGERRHRLDVDRDTNMTNAFAGIVTAATASASVPRRVQPTIRFDPDPDTDIELPNSTSWVTPH